MNAEQHALAIFNAIQTAEQAGYLVERCPGGLLVADHYTLAEPTGLDEPWEMVASA